jgi:hypothetical protein
MARACPYLRCGVFISASAAAAAAEYFGPWASQHLTLIRALASAKLLDGEAAVASAVTLAVAINDALAKMQHLAWVVAYNDSALSALFRRLIERWIRLCYFHAKKTIMEHIQKHGAIPAKDLVVVRADEVEPSLDAIFDAPPVNVPNGRDTLWSNFKVVYTARADRTSSAISQSTGCRQKGCDCGRARAVSASATQFLPAVQVRNP